MNNNAEQVYQTKIDLFLFNQNQIHPYHHNIIIIHHKIEIHFNHVNLHSKINLDNIVMKHKPHRKIKYFRK